MEEALAAHAAALGTAYRPLDVLVELGGGGGRTGARDLVGATGLARAIADAPHLRLAGVGGYEAALAADSDAASLAAVRSFLAAMRELHLHIAAEGWYPDDVVPVVTAGGSAYFDDVAEVLGGLTESGARVVLRSGAYLTHDDGHYRHLSPLGEQPAHHRPGAGQRDPRLGAGEQPARTRTGAGRRRQAGSAVRPGTSRGAAATTS